MHLLHPLLFLLTLLNLNSLLPVHALHESDVGVLDWHKHLVGVPLISSPVTKPSFQRVEVNGTDEVLDIIVVATGSNVLAALNAADGSVLWRYIFEAEDGILGYYKSPKGIATLSGLGGSTLRLFNPTTGALLIESQLHHPTLGAFSDPPYFGKEVLFDDDGETMYVLTNGYEVRAVDVSSGEVRWRWVGEDGGSLILNNKLSLSSSTLYIFGYGASIASYTLHCTTLDLKTGKVVMPAKQLDAKITDPLSGFVVLRRRDIGGGVDIGGDGEEQGRAVPVWVENGMIRYAVLSRDVKEKTRVVKGSGYETLLDLDLNTKGHGEKEKGSARCLVTRSDGSAFVLSFEGEVNRVMSLGEVGGTLNSEEVADSLYAGGLDEHGNEVLTRVYWSHKDEIAYADTFNHQLQKHDTSFAFDTKTHGVIAHVALDPRTRNLFVTTSTGAIQLWSLSPPQAQPADGAQESLTQPPQTPKHHLLWTREESLASIATAEFVHVPEKDAQESLMMQAGEGFWGRVGRHLHALLGAVSASSASSSSLNSASPLKNNSGKQLIIIATHFGKLFALDGDSGEVVWSRLLGLGWAGQLGGRIVPGKMFVMGGQDGGDEVVVVCQRRADNSLVDTVVFHVHALTGADATGVSRDEAVLEGHDVIAGPLVEAFLVDEDEISGGGVNVNGNAGDGEKGEGGKVVMLLDEFLQVFLYPDTEATQALFRRNADKVSFPLKTAIEGRSRVMGHQVSPPPHSSSSNANNNPDADDEDSNLPRVPRPVAHPTWSLTLPPNEHVQALVPSLVKGPIASIGKVLGDRRTLYKYLNPRLVGVVSRVEPTITDDGTVNEKGSSDMSAYSNDTLSIKTFAENYVFPYGVTAIGATKTKFGISSKNLIIATNNHRIQAFPRAFLDPRRPHRKPTTSESEEGLMQYDPLVIDDQRRIISHKYDIANVQRIITSPTLLESTSLVFAYGLDVFLTRVSTSGTFDVLSEGFNKVQLVVTVCGLAVGAVVVRPMVGRKKLRGLWYPTS
ncbi:hypothetical protein CVT24_000285 [Panaeolus cyanescens]|uniref:ER membrane protein complex subunit 1 n=1 Tax=Panaeolus cyanescens TaxID=181874 RepID=A0A409YD97_9AGAR|nr:hypothetical protein CVT24_000285 [Panaeolus cyanescens]